MAAMPSSLRMLLLIAVLAVFCQCVSAQAKIPYGWSNVGGASLTLAKSVECPVGKRKCSNVIRAWGGAALDRADKRLILFGGGHGDYDGNEEYALEYGSAKPSFSMIYKPTEPGNFNCANFGVAEADGHTGEEACTGGLPALRSPKGACYENPAAVAPNSRHSYFGLAGIDKLETGHPGLFVIGGSFTCGAGSGDQKDAWVQDLGSGVWTHTPVPKPWNGSLGAVIADYDAKHGAVAIVSDYAMGWFEFRRRAFKMLNDDVSGGIHDFGAIDRTANEFIVFEPHANINRVYAFNLSTGRKRDLTRSAPGCKALVSDAPIVGDIPSNGSGISWDDSDKSLVIWPNAGGKVFVYKNGNCTEEDYSTTGTPPTDSAHAGAPHTSNGTYGRWQNVAPGLFVLVNDWDLPAKFLCRNKAGCSLE
jgi:hypothetical protein